MSPMQVNPMQEKRMFLQTAIDESQTLPSQAYASGAQLRWNLPQVGVAKKLRIYFNVPVTQGATAATGVGAKAPFSLFTSVEFRDYAGIQRVFTSAWMLNLLNLVKKFGFDPSSGGPVDEGYSSSVWEVTKDQLTGYFDIPISASEMDPTGSLNLEITNGVSTVILQCNNSFFSASGIDTPLIGAAGCTATPSATATVTVEYYYWEPVTVPGGGLIRPDAVLYPNIIHELLGTLETDNLSAGQEHLYTLRTGREFHRILQSFVNNNALSYDEMTLIRFLYNGNTPTIAEPLQPFLSRMRDQLYRDLPAGTAYFNFTRRPWDSNKWGQLQTGITLDASATMANPYLETLTEAFFAPQSQ